MSALQLGRDRRSLRNFALATLIVRDGFGYIPGGLVFLLLLEWQWMPVRLATKEFTQWPGELLVVVFLLLLSYPVGRVLFNIGAAPYFERVGARINPISLRGVQGRLCKYYEAPLNLSAMKPFGLSPSVNSSSGCHGSEWYILVFHELSTRWVFLQRPDLYFVNVTRANTLRILADTTLGLVLVSTLLLFVGRGESLGHLPVATVGLTVAFVAGIISYRLRVEQAKAELFAAYTVYSQWPPTSGNAP